MSCSGDSQMLGLFSFVWSWVSAAAHMVGFKGHARCLPCAGLYRVLLVAFGVCSYRSFGVARAVDGYMVISELVSPGDAGRGWAVPLGKASLWFWAR